MPTYLVKINVNTKVFPLSDKGAIFDRIDKQHNVVYSDVMHKACSQIMKSSDFKDEFEKAVKESFVFISNGISKGKISFTSEPFFSPFIRFAETRFHFIAELVGVRSFIKNGIIDVQTRSFEKPLNTTSYIVGQEVSNQDESALISINSVKATIERLVLSPGTDKDKIENRLGIKLNVNGLRNVNSTIAVNVGEQADNLIFHEVDLVTCRFPNIYYRHINVLIATQKAKGRNEFRKWLRSEMEDRWKQGRPLGITFESNNDRMSKTLLSLSEQNISERVLDKFIQEHSKLFAASMGYKKVFPQISLEWQTNIESDPDRSIPDYVMEGHDGSYHILDLKKGFLGKSIVRGKIGRKQFISYVRELIAQISEYERYFDHPANQSYARDVHGISINSNLKLIGVVGGYYEVDQNEVQKVLRQYNSKISIISYFELSNLIKIAN